MYFTSCIGDAIRIPLRLTLSLLSCFSLGVVQLTGAAPTMKPSITVEQYLGLHLQTPKIFFPSSDSQVSRSILTGQPNHAEIDMASPKRLYTCCISFLLYMLYILSTKHTDLFLYCLLERKNVGILIFTCPPFQIPIHEAQD